MSDISGLPIQTLIKIQNKKCTSLYRVVGASETSCIKKIVTRRP